ncbi:MAG: hypothetical protein EOP34_03120 [Rickettsiales bacterium]|nr:MAG: hypothetical protein EOP34_03120 [Rickettsiales bacterium]
MFGKLSIFVKNKRQLAAKYIELFKELSIEFVNEPSLSEANYWLNAIVLDNLKQREEFLAYTNDRGVMTRPVWQLMNRLPMFKHCQTDELKNSIWLADRMVNIPSGYRVDNNEKIAMCA